MHISYLIHINNQSCESRTHSSLLITCKVCCLRNWFMKWTFRSDFSLDWLTWVFKVTFCSNVLDFLKTSFWLYFLKWALNLIEAHPACEGSLRSLSITIQLKIDSSYPFQAKQKTLKLFQSRFFSPSLPLGIIQRCLQCLHYSRYLRMFQEFVIEIVLLKKIIMCQSYPVTKRCLSLRDNYFLLFTLL